MAAAEVLLLLRLLDFVVVVVVVQTDDGGPNHSPEGPTREPSKRGSAGNRTAGLWVCRGTDARTDTA